MHPQPAAPPGRAARERLLLTPPVRLGWTFRSRRELISPYPGLPPDPEVIRQQGAARLAAATASWRRARKWGIRPSLIIFISLAALAGCAHAINPSAQSGQVILTALILAGPGFGWAGWRYAQYSAARAADPRQQYQAAHGQWASQATEHERSELDRVAAVPEWGSADLRTPRTDIYGGTLTGWRSLLTVHGASILARQPLLVADLSGQIAVAELAALARGARVPSAEYVLPRDLDRSGLLTRLSGQQLAGALAEAIHAGLPGTARSDRAVDVRVLEQLCTALEGHGLTPARLAAAVQVALGRQVQPGLLTDGERDLIGGELFGEAYQAQIGTNLVRLDAFLSDLARHSGTGPAAPSARPAYCTFFAVEPGARSVSAEVLAALVIHWLTVEVTASTATAPAVVIAGADEITRQHLERLADACDRRNVPLTLLFRHLRDDAVAMIGGGTTAFMRLGNHHEAEQAAAFIGRHHKFVLSAWTATRGGEHSTTRGSSESWGTSQSRGTSATRGWSEDHLFSQSTSGSRTRSREDGQNYSYAAEQSQTDGTSWSDAASTQRVYEYAVEPAVLQNLPDGALLLAGRGAPGADPLAVECDPVIVTLPGFSAQPLAPVTEHRHIGPPRAAPPPDWWTGTNQREQDAWPASSAQAPPLPLPPRFPPDQ
jgi:hypothetical protein